MNAGNIRFKLTWSSLWHLWHGATQFVFAQAITILRLILLLDVSKWQGVIDFVKMLSAGGDGVFIKCAQGSASDPKFVENWAKAKQAGIPRGTYFFYDSRVDPKTQAAKWWDLIKGDRGELMHFLDLEENYGGPWKGWRNWKICLQEFMRLSGLPASKIGIYTGYYYWIANSPTNLADLNWFAQFALWLAWYTLIAEHVKIPKPWTSLLFWQFGTPVEGEKYGVESLEIDQSYFNGDEQAYKQRFALVVTEPPTEPPIVVIPPTRPEITPEPRLWNAEVYPLRKMTVRTYPLVADDTKTADYVYGGELFTGKIWSGNDYLWIRIETSARPQLIGKWVAVRRSDGLEKFIKLEPAILEDDPWTDYYIGLHDFESPLYHYKPRVLNVQNPNPKDNDMGFPEMIPFVKRQGMPLTEEILWFLFDLCLAGQYGFRYDSPGWRVLTRDQKRKAASEFETFYDSKRFITNNTGIDENYNPIGEAVLGQKHRSGIGKQLEVACGGNLFLAVSHTPHMMVATDVDGVKRRIACIQIQMWDGKNPEPNLDIFNPNTHKHLFHSPTIATPFGYDGKWTKTGPWRVDPFSFFNGRGMYVLYGTQPNFVPKHRLRRLRQSELLAWRDPFVPHR